MEEKSLNLKCARHSKEIFVFLIHPDSDKDTEALIHCCNECLMEISSLNRNGILCLFLKDVNIFFRKISKNSISPSYYVMKNKHDRNRKIGAANSNIFSNLISLYKSVFGIDGKDPQNLSEMDIIMGLQDLVHPFQQNLILEKTTKVLAGSSDFSFESCAYLPEKSYIFVGNRSGDLFVIHKDTKEILKKIICPERIGAVKYIPEKKAVVVSGLTKYILKIDIETLKIVDPVRPGQTLDYKNFIVIEYIKERDLLLLGGFNVEHSIELYNFNDLGLVKTMTFWPSDRLRADELWISMSIESCKSIVLGYRSGNLQVWSIKEFELVHSVRTFEHIYALEYQDHQNLVYTGHLNGVIQIWKMKRGKLYKMKYLNTGACTINKMRFLPSCSSKYLLVSNFSKKLSLWTYLGQKVDEIVVFDEPSRSILVFDETNIMSTGASPGVIYFLEVKSIEPSRQRENHEIQIQRKFEGKPLEDISQQTSLC